MSHAPTLTSRAAVRRRVGVLLALTFVVSFCSFAYEFVYSELLAVVYGGTVTQYVITIGLYFFSLGVGSALSDDLAGDARTNFFRTEVYLAALAPAGFLFVVALNSVWLPEALPAAVVWIAARLPAIVVGFLSGFELPLLTTMVNGATAGAGSARDAGADDEGGIAGGVEAGTEDPLLDRLGRIAGRGHALVVGVLSGPFRVDADGGGRSGLSIVLAMDYVGGLFGAVVYARVLYPRLGLIPTIFVLALLNGVAALAFAVHFGGLRMNWGGRGEAPAGASVGSGGVGDGGASAAGGRAGGGGRSGATPARALVVVCLLLTAAYAGAVVQHDRVDRTVSEFYLEHEIESEYPRGAMQAEITGQETTRYQHVVEYTRTWTGAGPNPYFANGTERCLRLGTAVQLCDSWADSYHRGLVDVPLSMYPNGTATDVLVVGGGDWIAVDRLRERGVDVDQVDIDRAFMSYAKDDPFLADWHDDAYEYDRLNATAADGYAYLQRTDESYDVVLLDVPGATDDDLLKLYSTEFYRSLRSHLEPDGVVVSWAYSPDGFPEHHKAYLNTVRAAGFTRHVPYRAWEDLDADGERERVERFYVLAPPGGDRPDFGRVVEEGGPYVTRHDDRYRDLGWETVPHYDGVRPNSVFHPNYDIVVD